MRIPLLLLFLFLAAAWRGDAQVPDPGMAAQQDPGMAQDAAAARQKLLKAADQLDMIQGNSEANKLAIEGMKADISRLQADNADLKQQLSALQAALARADSDRAKERKALLDEVASLVASKNVGGAPTAAKHHEIAEITPDDIGPPSTEVHTPKDTTSDADAPVHPHHAAVTDDADSPPDAAPAPKAQKGYYHVVESGETLSMICAAYRDQGVKVTLSQVRKANGLTSKSVLKVGQKLFIPKPGD